MSVHKSLRRVSKNSYLKSVNDLSRYAYSRTIAMGIEDKVDRQYQAQIIKYVDIVLDRSFIASSILDSDLVDTSTCDERLKYLDQSLIALDVLSKYLSFLLGVMRENKIWIHKSQEYTMQVFRRFASMIVDSRDSFNLNREFVKEKRRELSEKYGEYVDSLGTFMLNGVCSSNNGKAEKRKRGRRGGKKRNKRNLYKSI